MDKIFLVHHIFKETNQMGGRSQHRMPGGETRVHHATPSSGHVVDPISHLVGHFPFLLGSKDASWPKTDYIYDPFD
jgi:hypothetical protein